MTTRFTKLDLTDGRGRPLWRLDEDYTEVYGPGLEVTVPAGFVTNFGTIPRWAYWLVAPSELGIPSLVHDYMCNETFIEITEEGITKGLGYSRWLADAILYESLKKRGLGTMRSLAVFFAVRFYAVWKGIK